MKDQVAAFHPLDPGRIEILDPLESAWWCRELHCSEQQLRQEAKMLAVPIQPDSSDSQDLNRTIDTLVSREGFSLAEAMEMVVPPIVEEIGRLPEDLHGFYMYLHQAMGPFAQGPVALIARQTDECVFSADAMGLRPLWQVETEDDYVFSSEPGVVSVERMCSEPKPLAPGEKALVLICLLYTSDAADD